MRALALRIGTSALYGAEHLCLKLVVTFAGRLRLSLACGPNVDFDFRSLPKAKCFYTPALPSRVGRLSLVRPMTRHRSGLALALRGVYLPFAPCGATSASCPSTQVRVSLWSFGPCKEST